MSDRKFEVVVRSKAGIEMKYPPVGIERCIKNMKTLESRGLRVCAVTSANGITESLTTQELEDVVSFAVDGD
jgi:hypothetical protein